jgi:ferrous iron transport protein B
MELPPYRLPTLKGLCIHTWERGWQYIRKAGTIILAISILLWAAMTFPGLDRDTASRYESRITELKELLDSARTGPRQQELRDRLERVRAEKQQAALQATLAGRIGTSIDAVTAWAGFDWKLNIALIGGVAAKEVIVSTLGTAYSLGGVDGEEGSRSLTQRLASDPSWSKVKGLSVMVFVLLYAPCFVSLVTMARESSWGWAAFSMVFNTLFAFGLAVAIYQLGIRVV